MASVSQKRTLDHAASTSAVLCQPCEQAHPRLAKIMKLEPEPKPVVGLAHTKFNIDVYKWYCNVLLADATCFSEVFKKLMVKPDETPMPLLVKTLTGKTMAVPAYASDSPQMLKLRIQLLENIPPEQQRLIFAAQQMEGIHNTVTDYGVQNLSTVHLVLRLRGGMYHETSAREDLQEAPVVFRVRVEGDPFSYHLKVRPRDDTNHLVGGILAAILAERLKGPLNVRFECDRLTNELQGMSLFFKGGLVNAAWRSPPSAAPCLRDYGVNARVRVSERIFELKHH